MLLTFIGLAILGVIVLAGLVALIEYNARDSRVRISKLEVGNTNLETRISTLEEAKEKRIPYNTLLGIEETLAAIIGAQIRADEQVEDAAAYLERAKTTKEFIYRAAELGRAVRGGNKKGNGK